MKKQEILKKIEAGCAERSELIGFLKGTSFYQWTDLSTVSNEWLIRFVEMEDGK